MKIKFIYLIFSLFVISSCDGQTKNKDCNSNSLIKKISELPEVKIKQIYIDSLSNHKHGVSYIVENEKIKNENYFSIKVGYNGKLHWETYYIFYVNKNKCDIIFFLDTISGNIITLDEWRKKNNTKISNMEELEFGNLFNEGTIIKFTPKDLNKETSEIKEFKAKLELYEAQHLLVEDFDPKNLQNLLNYDVFENAEWHIDSSWLEYFLNKYKIDVVSLRNIFQIAIHQEDFNAVKIFINKGYIVSNKDIELANETKQESDEKIKINKNYNGIDKNGDPTFYVDKFSKMTEILQLLKSKYLTTHIEDPDGYTNLRKEKSTTSEILQKIKSGESIDVLDNTGNWFLIKTKEGKAGYVHKSRIKSGNSIKSASIQLYDRPDFSSFSREILAKGEVEIVHQTSGWDFIKVDGTTGYLPTEEKKKELQKEEKKKFSFLADEDEVKPKEKKGFWDNLFG